MRLYTLFLIVVIIAMSSCGPKLRQYKLSGDVTVNNECQGTVPESVQMMIKLHYKDSTNSPESWTENVALNPNGEYSVETVRTNLEAKQWEIDIAVPCDYISCPVGKECVDTRTKERNWNIVPVVNDNETRDITFSCTCR
ncbi:hypothetical protein JMN32_03395 [Fulvivirga sp. 29W222]|uniref:Uncharacterized protein n=1 Tax=Fulvivirga marina TaxID=2494733 RepID=A0A937KAZ9_9BACT|nr:hypothetical protein [Fulvivirga marina]MBL6445337.1 hypothetical protein [Fulvivirga marina]